MPLRAGVGKKVGFSVAAGLGAMVGTIGALTNPDEVWQKEVFPTAQEMAFGNPRMVQESMRAGLTAVLSSGAEEDTHIAGDYYYGRPVDLKANKTLGTPVSGEIVFGMYNLRR